MENLDKAGWWLSGLCAAALAVGSLVGIFAGPPSSRGVFIVETILGGAFVVLAWVSVRRG